MRLILLTLLFISESVFSRFYEKRRFDRSIDNDFDALVANEQSPMKRWTFTDHETRYRAYRDRRENDCYLEKLLEDNSASKIRSKMKRHESKILYASMEALTKLEAWRIAGGRIVDFCSGRNILLLEDTITLPGKTVDPFFNIIPLDENDIVTRRVADVVLTPLISRAKRQIVLEKRQELNKNSKITRSRRQVQQPRGRFRGQTQSQYLNLGNGNEKEGKAEAEATQQSSHAVVSGSRGMGQAQSMSMGSSGCEDCPTYVGEGAPDKYIRHPDTSGSTYRGTNIPRTTGEIHQGGRHIYPGSFPTIEQPPGDRMIQPDRIVPGSGAGRTYPGGTSPSSVSLNGRRIYPGIVAQNIGSVPSNEAIRTGISYPGGIAPGITPGGGTTYPGSDSRGGVSYPDSIPGIPISRDGVVHTGSTPGSEGGNIYPGRVQTIPTTHGGTVYPSGRPGPIPATTTTSGGTYPNGMPGTVINTGGPYSGGMPGTTTPTGGGTYPGNAPGTTTATAGRIYPSIMPSGGGVAHPGSAPRTTITTATGEIYPSTIPGTISGSGTYPSAIPGANTIGDRTSYPSSRPNTAIVGGGTYPGTIPDTTKTGGGTYTGAIPGTVTTGGGAYPGAIPGTVTTGGGAYPGAIPGTVTTGGGAYPGTIPGTVTTGGGAYPGALPGTVTTGGGAYPGALPGTVTTGGGVYPGAIPGTVTTGGGAYPGAIPGTVTTGGGVYPGAIPGTVTTGGGVYPGAIPGTVTTGGKAYPGAVPDTTITGGGITYANGVPNIPTNTVGVSYPGNAPRTTTTTGGTIYPGIMPGTTIAGGGTYPENGIRTPQSGLVYPGNVPVGPGGQVVTQSKPSTDTAIYPSEQFPGGGVYPVSRGGVMMGTGVPYPGMITTGSIPGVTGGSTITGTGETVVRPGAVVLPSDQLRKPVQYIGNYPGFPGSVPTEKILPNIMTGSTTGTGTILSYPQGTQSNVGQDGYPTGIQAKPDNYQRVSTDHLGVPYPHEMVKYPGSNTVEYPGVEGYQDRNGQVTGQQGLYYTPTQGQYPLTIPGTSSGYVPGTSDNDKNAQQYSHGGQNARGYYPGLQYPTRTGSPPSGTDASQYYQQIGSVPPAEDDDANSQASGSVKQTDAGTQASAAAQGKFGQGTAQSQVTGTYSGSGSFSAQAGSSDNNKSAQTEISGGKEGATSSSQGVGGHGKSQALVQLDSESGATQTGAQTSGWNHGTNSQVQASSKGGMADAQANGEGSTSSQAQIGFQPYMKDNEKVERQSKPFRGGGTASAQSGTHRGQSQSQLQGSFQYGITYTGAAQAGSGSGAAASRQPFNFSFTDTELFKPFKPYNTPQITKDNRSDATNTSSDLDYEYSQDNSQGLQTSSSSRKTVIANVTRDNSQNLDNNQDHLDDTMYDYEDGYDGNDYDTPQMQTSINSGISKTYNTEQNSSDDQSQTIHITSGNQYDIKVKQDSSTGRNEDMLQPGQSLSGYTIPSGFRGKITSMAGDETVAHGNGKAQSQTVSLVPTQPNSPRENKSPLSETRSLKTTHEKLEDHVLSTERNEKFNFPRIRNQQLSNEYTKPSVNVPIKPSYYTITNSFTGKIDGIKSSPKKYEHRYYTKSSTCGYFTFSCNVVHGSNGRTKICKPKLPTYSDGTPMKC